MNYAWLKNFHVACVALTALLLVVRLALATRGTDYRTLRPLRWLPHAVDTLLLGSALALVTLSGQYPFVQPWLTAKVLALPVYIIAASLALTPGRPARLRSVAAIGALALLAYIVSVALTRDWIPFPH